MKILKAVVRKELRDALRDRRSLLSAVSHDLRTPLAAAKAAVSSRMPDCCRSALWQE